MICPLQFFRGLPFSDEPSKSLWGTRAVSHAWENYHHYMSFHVWAACHCQDVRYSKVAIRRTPSVSCHWPLAYLKCWSYTSMFAHCLLYGDIRGLFLLCTQRAEGSSIHREAYVHSQFYSFTSELQLLFTLSLSLGQKNNVSSKMSGHHSTKPDVTLFFLSTSVWSLARP